MDIVEEFGNDELARVFVARMRDHDPRSIVEFVESVQPPISREGKWVIIVSTMFGCPIGCRMCDAGGNYSGMLTSDEILAQIEECVIRRYPDRKVPSRKFKVQFSRMGEPSLNPAVLDALDRLPALFDAPGLIASLSTIAPSTATAFFRELIAIKERSYGGGRFQMQFSIHTTDTEKRKELIPIRTWTFRQMAAYGKRICRPEEGDRKAVLNFATMSGHPIDADIVREYFDPERFIIKLTPLNPTLRSLDNGIRTIIEHGSPETSEGLKDSFVTNGYEVIVSMGEEEENRIGSNCGQYVQRIMREGRRPKGAYELEHYHKGT